MNAKTNVMVVWILKKEGVRALFNRNKNHFLFLLLWIGHHNLNAQPKSPVNISVTEGTNMAIAVSPDGKTIAMDIQGTLHTLPVSGGLAKPLTDGLGDERQPCWAPDGKKIAFQSYRDGTYHIWAINKDGSGLKQVSFGIYDEREPAWSPDGTKIIFSSDRSGNYDIWELKLADGSLTQLTKDSADDYNPAYSANGAQFAFVSNRKAGGLYVCDSNEKESLIVPFKGGTFAAPSWSPDGKYITFNGLYGGKSLLQLVGLADLNVTTISDTKEDVFPFRAAWVSGENLLYSSNGKIQQRRLGGESFSDIPFRVNFTLHPPRYAHKSRDFDSDSLHKALGILGPVISPDGNDVAFAADGDLWLLKKGNKKPVQLTSDPAVDIDPAFSSDGKKLAFVSDREGGYMALWIHDLETGAEKQVTRIDQDIMYPSWSPDGTQIAMLINANANVWGNSTLNVLTVATGRIREIHTALFVPGKPSWSADGKSIALSALEHSSARFREGTNRFLIISLENKSERFLSPSPGRTLATREKNGPVWSPDGKKMAYVQDAVLWVIDVNDTGEIKGEPRKVTAELSDVPTWAADSETLLFIATDQLKKVHLPDGKVELVPLDLAWKIQKPSGEMIIHAGKLFDGRLPDYRKDVDITVKGNRITKIEPHQAGRKNVLDASGQVIIPGMFEMHTHQYAGTGQVQGRNWLSFGITSVRETGADPYDALERKEAWSSGVRPGPREFFTGDLLDGKRVYYGMSNSISTTAQLDLELERCVKLNFDFIKTYVRFPDSLQKRVAGFAHQHGIPVSSHEIYPATAYGVDCVEHIKATSRRGYSPKQTSLNKSYEDVIQIVSKSGINMTPTISLFGGFYLMAESDPDILNNKQINSLYPKKFVSAVADMVKQRLATTPSIRDTYAETNKVMRTLVDAGAHITPGTDSPFTPYGLSLHVELQSFVAAGLSPFEALRSATLWSAQAVGVEKDLGTIEPGKLADLVIVDGDPLSNIKDAWNVKTVIKNGILYQIDDLLNFKSK